jgi:hypothetical protein
MDRGTVQSRQTATFGFAMAFRLNVLLMDMTTDITAVGYVICTWLRVHQPDLLGVGQDAFALDLDVLDNGMYDALIQIDLRQAVTVSMDADGDAQIQYLPEPEPLFVDDLPWGSLPSLPLLKSVSVVGDGQVAPFDPAA